MIPLLFGGGEQFKIVGDYGVRSCPDCGFEAHFTRYEVHTELQLFFVPALTWNHYEAVGCDRCGAKFRLSEDDEGDGSDGSDE